MMKIPNIRDRKTFPGMTRWFDPALLAKLLWNVIVSGLFGQYADRRLMIAALDTAKPDELVKRAEKARLIPGEDNAIWIDFVADLGDGFDSTYAVASLVAERQLKLGEFTLPRAQMLIFGGDEVYPKATANAYRNQMGLPYQLALPDPDDKSDIGIPVYAVPGNHDWYDGLVNFLAFLGRHKPWHMGAWRAGQRRSYFALQLTERWWLWATDIQLADDMDQAQADYFKAIAEGMPANSKIILCSAEPGWLYTKTNRNSFEIVDYAVRIARDADRNLSVPILLSGDTHHYSRYAAGDGTQFITSGGGGAFLHPTHQLEDEITFPWFDRKTTVSLKRDPETNASSDNIACYPSRERSRCLVWRNAFFPITNWDFALLLGTIYWLFSIALSLRNEWDIYIGIVAIFMWAFIGYTRRQEVNSSASINISAAVQGLAHSAAVFLLAQQAITLNAGHFRGGAWYDIWLWLLSLLGEVGIPGAIVGAAIFGLNLLITCRWLKINMNDAFSALRLDSYKNFLRICIKDETVTIYPVGLDKVPSRNDWHPNRNGQAPLLVPSYRLADQAHLIERPIRCGNLHTD
jgi:hypothetical protein